jgi:hypothetical protein
MNRLRGSGVRGGRLLEKRGIDADLTVRFQLGGFDGAGLEPEAHECTLIHKAILHYQRILVFPQPPPPPENSLYKFKL